MSHCALSQPRSGSGKVMTNLASHRPDDNDNAALTNPLPAELSLDLAAVLNAAVDCASHAGWVVELAKRAAGLPTRPAWTEAVGYGPLPAIVIDHVEALRADVADLNSAMAAVGPGLAAHQAVLDFAERVEQEAWEAADPDRWREHSRHPSVRLDPRAI